MSPPPPKPFVLPGIRSSHVVLFTLAASAEISMIHQVRWCRLSPQYLRVNNQILKSHIYQTYLYV